jgi:hypothetical protein
MVFRHMIVVNVVVVMSAPSGWGAVFASLPCARSSNAALPYPVRQGMALSSVAAVPQIQVVRPTCTELLTPPRQGRQADEHLCCWMVHGWLLR